MIFAIRFLVFVFAPAFCLYGETLLLAQACLRFLKCLDDFDVKSLAVSGFVSLSLLASLSLGCILGSGLSCRAILGAHGTAKRDGLYVVYWAP